jgi:ABC-type transporter Mla subunit MlaD
MAKKGLFLRIWDFIRRIFSKFDDTAKRIVEIATEIVERVKTFDDKNGAIIDVLTHLTPFPADEKAVQIARAVLPKLLAGLTFLNTADFDNVDELLRKAIEKINAGDPETRKAFWHGLGALLAECMSDGEFTWSDSIAVVEYVHKFEKK